MIITVLVCTPEGQRLDEREVPDSWFDTDPPAPQA